MKFGDIQVIHDPVYGYRRLEPIPDDKELTKFYQSQYYDLIRKGGRAPELRRSMAGGEEAKRERDWLRNTLFDDILSVLKKYASGKSVLDVGCGTGEFISYLGENGCDVTGIEPSSEAAPAAQKEGLKVHNATLEEFVESLRPNNSRAFGVITLLNVLEHTPHPEHIIELSKEILEPGGVICIRVPNDFNEMQFAAQKKLEKKPWWIAIPDHINYFNYQSLENLLERFGFEVIYVQSDFPMELFLLQGDDYTNNPELGGKCHQKRILFETAISGELRRRLYQALAVAGIGRNCLTFGRLKVK